MLHRGAWPSLVPWTVVVVARLLAAHGWLCQLSNFFDPDSYLSITAMSYAFDDYLFEQSRGLLETNEQFMCTEDISVRVSRAVVAWCGACHVGLP